MGTTTDTDTKVLAENPDTTTEIATYLNGYMATHAEARDAYRAVWGVEWTALGCGAEWTEGQSTSSEAVTVAR